MFITVPILCVLIAYLFGILVKCEINISKWSENERLLLASEGLVLLVVGVIIAIVINTNRKS